MKKNIQLTTKFNNSAFDKSKVELVKLIRTDFNLDLRSAKQCVDYIVDNYDDNKRFTEQTVLLIVTAEQFAHYTINSWHGRDSGYMWVDMAEFAEPQPTFDLSKAGEPHYEHGEK